MRSLFLTLATILLLVVPGVTQMRSTISAGLMRGDNPGRIVARPDFGGRHFHHGNRFGTVIYPFGLYDGFYGYDERYRDVVEQPAPVVVIRDDRPPAPPVAPVQIAPADPKLIDVPEPGPSRAVASARTPAAIFIFNDGRRIEAQNYTITDSLLTVKEAHRPTVQFPLEQLNADATVAENRQRGLDLHLPENRSEILIGF